MRGEGYRPPKAAQPYIENFDPHVN